MVTVLRLMVSLLEPSQSPEFAFLTKVSLSGLLLVPEVSNVQTTLRKPYAANLLVMSDLTLDRSFKVKLGRVNIKVPHLAYYRFWRFAVYSQPLGSHKISCEFFGDVRFELRPILQGQTVAGQHKRACILFITGFRGLQCTVNLWEIISCESFGDVRFDLGPLF